MFTDQRVIVRHVELVQTPGKEGDGCGALLLAVFLHFALGPIGWIVSIMMHGSEDEAGNKTVKQKSKLKLAQCQLCRSVESPEVLDSQWMPRKLMFLVHPRFKSRLDEEKANAREETLSSSE